MRRFIIMLAGAIGLIFVLTGCHVLDTATVQASDVLLEYMPESEGNFSGDGGYYHEIQSVDRQESKSGTVVVMRGQIRKDSAQTLESDRFEIVWTVDADKILQETEGELLNESRFSELELVHLPLQIGTTWQFKAKDSGGTAYDVTGRIEKMDETSGVLEILYTTKDGYEERRTLQKGLGTTDFLKKLTYKTAVAYTGYHLMIETEAATTSAEEAENSDAIQLYDSREPETVDEGIWALIYAFDKAWAEKAENEDVFRTTVQPLVETGSAAEEKVNIEFEGETLPDLSFEAMKIYGVEEAHNGVISAFVLEKYQSGKKLYVNDMVYVLIKKDGSYVLMDFYPKPAPEEVEEETVTTDAATGE